MIFKNNFWLLNGISYKRTILVVIIAMLIPNVLDAFLW